MAKLSLSRNKDSNPIKSSPMASVEPIYIDREVIKEVKVEVPVYITKEVIKEVQVPVEVIKEVLKVEIKEVPVEKVVEIIVEKEVVKVEHKVRTEIEYIDRIKVNYKLPKWAMAVMILEAIAIVIITNI